MKFKILSALSIFALLSCTKNTGIVKVSVKNPIAIDRKSDLVELDLRQVKSKLNNEAFIVKDATGKEVVYQVSNDGKVLLLVDSKSGEVLNYTIEKGSPAVFKSLTMARFITERKDDFAWENDKVAFRLYGPALVATDGPSTGLDIWYKRTPELIVNKWYKDDLAGVLSYHEDHGEGLDDYKVGPTLGAGSMAPYIDKKLILNQNFVKQEILENGPLRSTFKLTYANLDFNGQSVSETRTISLDAGSQLSRITQEYGTKTSFDVAAGVIKRPNQASVNISSDNTFIVYEEPSSDKVSGIYIALVNPEGWNQLTENTYNTAKGESYSHILGVTNYKPDNAVTYYTGYGWNKFGFEDKSEFEKYLQQFVKQQQNPLKVKIK